MRVLVVVSDPARADLVAEGLAGVEPLDLRWVACFEPIEAAAFAPDVVVVVAETLGRETLRRLREAGVAASRPVILFVDRSAPGVAEEAIRAGVTAYVVDGLAAGRIRPVLEVALSRFALMSELRQDLDKAKADLAARKVVERAKALLMRERGMDEGEAYGLLRKLSMDTGRPLGAVAGDLLAFAGVLKGKP